MVIVVLILIIITIIIVTTTFTASGFPKGPEMQTLQAVKDLSLLQKEKPKQKRLGTPQSLLQTIASSVQRAQAKPLPHRTESEEECWQTAGFDTQLDAGLVYWPRRRAAEGGTNCRVSGTRWGLQRKPIVRKRTTGRQRATRSRSNCNSQGR